MARAQEALGGIDVLVNNAGIVAATRIWDLPEDEFRRMVDVNLTGTYNVTRAALPALLASDRKPAIVNLGSTAARRRPAGRLALRRVQGRGHQFHQGAGPRTGAARGARQLRRARHHRDGHDAGQIRRKLGNRTQTRHSAATLRLARRSRPGHSLPGIGPVLVFHRHRGRRQWRLPHSLGARSDEHSDRMLSILDLFRDDTTAAFQEDVMEHLECSRDRLPLPEVADRKRTAGADLGRRLCWARASSSWTATCASTIR